MNATAQGGNSRKETLPWLGHNAWWLALGLNAWLVLSAVAGLFFRPQMRGNLAVAIIGSVVIGAWVYLWFEQRQHDRSLCVRCIANTPLDPQRETEKRDFWLKTSHRGDGLSRRYRRAFLGVLLGIIVAMTFAPEWLYAVWVLAFMGVVGPVFTISVQMHKRLGPWCPYCRRGKRWKDQGEPEPSPTPTASHDLEKA